MNNFYPGTGRSGITVIFNANWNYYTSDDGGYIDEDGYVFMMNYTAVRN